MSPKILVANIHGRAMYRTSLKAKGLYPDANILLANNFNTSFNTLATNERGVATRNVILVHTRI